jgi:hypothetical protein
LTFLVGAQWIAHANTALHGGMRDLDSLRYHGPDAASWVQRHNIVHLQSTSTENQEFFFPGNAELLDGFGILLFARDLLTPVRNLLGLAFAFLAVWCAGKRLGSGAAALAGVAAVCSTPLVASIEPGSAKNDIIAIAFLLATTALLVQALPSRRGEVDRRLVVVAGLAGGLAAGTKLTVLGIVGALLVAMLVAVGRRAAPRVALAFVVPALLTGGLWYVRNIVYTGTPLPWFRLPLGPLTLAGPRSGRTTPSRAWPSRSVRSTRRCCSEFWRPVCTRSWVVIASATIATRDASSVRWRCSRWLHTW